MADACTSFYNTSSWTINGEYKNVEIIYTNEIFLSYLDTHCRAYFDRISCWPPTKSGVLRTISCPPLIFPDAASDGKIFDRFI
jgi:hypothetical protein